MIHNYIDISLIESYVPTVSHFHCDYKHLSCPCYVGLSIQDVNYNHIIINFHTLRNAGLTQWKYKARFLPGPTISILILRGFNAKSVCGLAAICESFVCGNLDINGYARYNGYPKDVTH